MVRYSPLGAGIGPVFNEGAVDLAGRSTARKETVLVLRPAVLPTGFAVVFLEAAYSWPRGVRLMTVETQALEGRVEETESPLVDETGRLSPGHHAPLAASGFVGICSTLSAESTAPATTPFKALESAAAGPPVVAGGLMRLAVRVST
jgi:hypothetical protein